MVHAEVGLVSLVPIDLKDYPGFWKQLCRSLAHRVQPGHYIPCEVVVQAVKEDFGLRIEVSKGDLLGRCLMNHDDYIWFAIKWS
jgi:hypothetical protein